MTLDDLKQAAAALDAPSQTELLKFLASLREERWSASFRKAPARGDSPTKWLSPEEFKARLDRIPLPAEE